MAQIDSRLDAPTSWRDNGAEGIECMALYEAMFTLEQQFDNPYDPEEVRVDAHFTLPNGDRVSVPAFWQQDFTRALVKGQEILRPTGAAGWRLRFTPRQPGDYSYEIAVTAHGNSAHLQFGPLGFTVLPSHDPGFLRRSEKDNAYLEFEDGLPYIGIGHNLCGWEWGGTDNRRGTFEYDEWLIALAANGANMAQFDFCEGDQLEWTTHPDELPFSRDWAGLNRYNQQTAWKMDQRLDRAAELGIYARISLLHWEDFDHEAENFPDWGWNRNPYNSANGGPVATAGLFFSDPMAKALYKKQLRYIVARWGYCKNILAFELWNEVDSEWLRWGEGESYAAHAGVVAAWHQEMASYLKEIDPNRHLLTTNFEHSYNGDAEWAIPEMDLSTFHRYTYYNPVYGDTQFATVPTLYGLITRRLAETGKPVLAGEFALSPGGDIQKERDPAGLALHQQLWSAVMLKALGTAMHWTWGSYMHANNLYHHYLPLSRFLLDEDLRGMQPFDNLGDGANPLLYLGLGTDARALLWLQDRGYDFAAMAAGAQPNILAKQKLHLPGLQAGDYIITFYDTWTIRVLGQQTLTIQEAGLHIDLPEFARDMALKVQPWREHIGWISADIGIEKVASATEIVGRRVALAAGGSGVGGALDQLRYVYLPVAGNWTLEARIDALTNLGESVRAGLMARASADADAPFVYLAINPTGKATWTTRQTAQAEARPLSAPYETGFYWRYRIERQGNHIVAAVSRDGANWSPVGSAAVDGWPASILLGFAAASKDDYTYVRAEFSDVRLTQQTVPFVAAQSNQHYQEME